MTIQTKKKPKPGRTSPMFYNKEQPLRDIFAAPYLPVVQKNGSVLMEFTYEEPRSTVTFRSVDQPTQQQRKLLLNLVNVWWSNLKGEFTGTKRQDGSCPEDTFKLHIDKLMDDCGLSGRRTEDREKVLTDLSALNIMQIDWLDRLAGVRTIMSFVRRVNYDYVTGYLDVSLEPEFFDKLLGFDAQYTKRFISLDVVNKFSKDTRAAALFQLLQSKGSGRQAGGNYGVVFAISKQQIIEHLSLEAMEQRSVSNVIGKAFKAIKDHTGIEYSFDRSSGAYRLTDSSKKLRDVLDGKLEQVTEQLVEVETVIQKSKQPKRVQDYVNRMLTKAERQELETLLLKGGFPRSLMDDTVLDDVIAGRRDHLGRHVDDTSWNYDDFDDFDDHLSPSPSGGDGIVSPLDALGDLLDDDDDF